MKGALVLIGLALACGGASASGARVSSAPMPASAAWSAPSHLVSIVRTFRLPLRTAERTFRFRVRADTPHLAGVVVSHGAVVSVNARSDDRVMGLFVSTRPWQRWGQGGWPQGCRHQGNRDVCIEAFEHCPLSTSRWRATIRKTSAPPTLVQVRLVFWRRAG